ncbi:MAG: insulinase family protein [Planctomycetota bacterium]|nr:MAG: insulinase family protein [Planctomycetota bacterium]
MIHIHTLANGLTILIEEMADVRSASFSLMMPAGSLYEEPGTNGTAAALADWITRGAGQYSNRGLSSALDRLGVQRDEQVGWNFLNFTGAMLADNLLPALRIYSEILTQSHLDESQFEPVMAGLEQGLLAQEDDLQRKTVVELRKRCYDMPWGRPSDGALEELEAITGEHVRRHYRRGVVPQGAILGIAGNVHARQVIAELESLLGSWKGTAPEQPLRVPAVGGKLHIEHHSAQTHLAWAYPAVSSSHPDYYAAWAATSILGGGSSSRLFTEVRENRGLVYTVYASLNTLKTEGRTIVYAGTTTERAQETWNVTLGELRRLAATITDEELERCKVRAKSSLIMQQESTGSRASSIARDWFHLGRVTTMDEIRQRVEELTVEQVSAYARAYPPENMTVVTIGVAPVGE